MMQAAPIDAREQQVLDSLKAVGPMTTIEMGRYFGLSKCWVQQRLAPLREKKAVRISAYDPPPEEVGGRHAPIYALNIEGLPDAKEPRRVAAKTRSKTYRERHTVEISVRRYGARGIAGKQYGDLAGADLGPWAALLR